MDDFTNISSVLQRIQMLHADQQIDSSSFFNDIQLVCDNHESRNTAPENPLQNIVVNKNLAKNLREEFGKNGFSTLQEVFILFILKEMVTGRKKLFLFKLLNIGNLPIEKDTLTTKLNRLKAKELITWKPQREIDLLEKGRSELDYQLRQGLGYQEKLIIEGAIDLIRNILAPNTANPEQFLKSE